MELHLKAGDRGGRKHREKQEIVQNKERKINPVSVIIITLNRTDSLVKNRLKDWDRLLIISNTFKHKDMEKYESKGIENYIQANFN